MPFRFEPNNECVFSFRKFDLHGDGLVLALIVNLNHHDFSSPFKNRYLIGYNGGLCGSNYVI